VIISIYKLACEGIVEIESGYGIISRGYSRKGLEGDSTRKTAKM
jgi:hypothetical protein